MDLLGHEMAVVALIDEERRRQRPGDRPLHGVAVAVADGDAFAGQHRPVAILQIGDLVGEGRERQRVRAHEHLAIAIADGERAALARHDHEIVIAAEDHGDGEGAFQPLQRMIDGADRIVAGPHLAGDEMGDDLGVGVAREGGALGQELFLQLAEVLDDAVMHHRDVVGHMRVRIGLGGLAVGRPAGVADAGLAEKRRRFEPRLEIAQLAFRAPAPELAVLHRGDARGIVAAIFEPLQRIDELSRDRPSAENANNAAHPRYSTPRPLPLATTTQSTRNSYAMSLYFRSTPAPLAEAARPSPDAPLAGRG